MDKGYKHVTVNVMFAHMKVYNKDIDTSTIHGKTLFNKVQKLFGERAASAMIKEYMQMDDMKVLDMVDLDTLKTIKRGNFRER